VTKSDAHKVATIIRSDKAKTQTYCEINKVSDQMNQAYGKNDKKTVDELSQKIERLEKILGPEYIALMDGLQKLGPENKKRIAEIMVQFALPVEEPSTASEADIGCLFDYVISDLLETQRCYRSGVRTRHLLFIHNRLALAKADACL
jgi:hypothetical protein